MPRHFMGGSGDAAAQKYLREHRQLQLPDLYCISTAPNITQFNGSGGLTAGGGGHGGSSGALLGPLHAFKPSFNNGVWGWQRGADGHLFWILSATDVGNFWQAYNPLTGCGVPGGGYDLYTSFDIVISDFDPSLYASLGPDAVANNDLGMFPCSYDSGINGNLISSASSWYIGATSGYGNGRWYKSPRGGGLGSGFSPCPIVNTWGELAEIADDGWGGGLHIGQCLCAGWVPGLPELLHVDWFGTCYYFGESGACYQLPDYGTYGDWITAASCIEGDGIYDSIWVLSNHGHNGGHITRFSPTEGIESWPLGASPAEYGAATCIRYYKDEGALYCFFGGEEYTPPGFCTCYKWHIADATIEWLNPVQQSGVSPVLSGNLHRSGIQYYFNSDLKLYDSETLEAFTDLELDPTGLPQNALTKDWLFDAEPSFGHWWDEINGVFWLLSPRYDFSPWTEIWPDNMVFGVPLKTIGSGGGPGPPGGGGGACFTLGKIFGLTDWPSSLVWDYRGQFLTADISRGEVESKIGLEADTLEITWAPQPGDTLGDGKTPVLEAFARGLFDEGYVEVWRALMPNAGDLIGSPGVPAMEGDCNTFGAVLMFAGRIGDVQPDRLKVVMKVLSRMETINLQVPTNLVEPTNIYAEYGVGVIPSGVAGPETVQPGSTDLLVYGSPATADDTYTNGFIVFQCGSSLAGVYARVIKQSVVEGYDAFCLQEPLPFAPTVGDTFIPFQQWPLDSSGSKYGGFRWVPVPNNSVVVI